MHEVKLKGTRKQNILISRLTGSRKQEAIFSGHPNSSTERNKWQQSHTMLGQSHPGRPSFHQLLSITVLAYFRNVE